MRKQGVLIIILAVVLAGCGTQPAAVQEKVLNEVKVQKVGESQAIQKTFAYPALVLSGQEAKIVAKMSGTVGNFKANTGDQVRIGQELAKIDDVNSGQAGGVGLNSNQVKQASIAVEQAATAYDLAKANYQNTLASADKQLELARIGRDASGLGQSNLGAVTSESLKSAQLSYEAAILAREQAQSNLENLKKTLNRSVADMRTNADVVADSAANTAGTLIKTIDNVTGLSGDFVLAYRNELGVSDVSAYSRAENAYDDAAAENEIYTRAVFNSIDEKLAAASKLAAKVKTLADSVKYLFDKSIASANLPLNSLSGTSLSGLQGAAAGYQAQITGAITALNAARQGVTNVALSSDTNLDNLQKVYELSLKQEAAAKQGLESLKAGNKSQQDSASSGYASSQSQYSAAQIQVNSQIAAAKSQLDIAELSYRNAALSLSGLYDSHLAIAPIDGIITSKLVSDGETVAAGQVLAIISRGQDYKLQFFANQEDLAYLHLGQEVRIANTDATNIKGHISSIAQSPDSMTKRFLVEVVPADAKVEFTLGTVKDVSVEYKLTASGAKNLILPLNVVAVGQNGNFILVLSGNKVVKAPVEIVKVFGEVAEIKAELDTAIEIIVEGNKLVQEGEEVKIKQ